jgi:hypothetical protein
LIGRNEFDDVPPLNVAAVLKTLPNDLTPDDFIGILKLALLTECATQSYEMAICQCADRSAAPWLRRFVTRVWTPDEVTHYLPYKAFLMELGFSESELDAEVKETQERQYLHYGGATALHMTTFGMIQECLTDSFHGLIANALRPAAPLAAAAVARIKRRETLHAVWYRDMTALQVEADPMAIVSIVSEVKTFRMPGTSLVPELQAQGARWQRLLGADSEQLLRDLFRFVQQTLQNVRQTGELVMKLAAEKNVRLGPVPVDVIDRALRRLGGPGYGLVGEAALERAGLGYMFAKRPGQHDRAFGPYEGQYERVRGLVRSWIASLLPPPDRLVLGTSCD